MMPWLWLSAAAIAALQNRRSNRGHCTGPGIAPPPTRGIFLFGLKRCLKCLQRTSLTTMGTTTAAATTRMGISTHCTATNTRSGTGTDITNITALAATAVNNTHSTTVPYVTPPTDSTSAVAPAFPTSNGCRVFHYHHTLPLRWIDSTLSTAVMVTAAAELSFLQYCKGILGCVSYMGERTSTTHSAMVWRWCLMPRTVRMCSGGWRMAA